MKTTRTYKLEEKEIDTVESALEETIFILRNRFEDRKFHPAEIYEELLEKIKNVPWE